MSIADQMWAAEELDAIYTEWKINPDYPHPNEIKWEFDKVMLLIEKFAGSNNA